MIAAIDADSIVYIIAWAHRENNKEEIGMIEFVQQRCDSFFQYLIESTKADHYIGFFSDKKSFRNRNYLVAPYKGTRPPKPEFVKEWEEVIKDYFFTEYGFKTFDDLEADDLVSVINEMYPDVIVCSPDKDLKQLPGKLFDYKKNQLTTISSFEAMKQLYTQLLTGDVSDNVKGVPGLGEAKVSKLFEGLTEEIEFATVVKDQFTKYYGQYYGEVIEGQTYDTIKTLCKAHRMYPQFEDVLTFDLRPAPVYKESLDEAALRELGW
jgi:5'-3' exonuclease